MREDLDLDYFRKRLEERLSAITAGQEAKKGGEPVELDQARVGQQAISQAASHLAGLERQRIQSALSRMPADEYGYCILCGEEITEGRLRFDPSAPTCISCARAAER